MRSPSRRSTRGLVRALSVAFLAVAAGGCEKVTVTGALVADLEVTPPDASVVAGETFQFQAAILDSEGNELGGRDLTWSVDDSTVASVSGGVVRGLAPGNTVVRATSEGASGSARVTVLKAPTVGLTTDALTFAGSSNGPNPAPGVVSVFNDGTGTLGGLITSVEYGDGVGGWLTAVLAATSAPTTLSLSVDAAGLAPGTYVARVHVQSSGGATASLTVTFRVGDSVPVIGMSRSEVGFSLVQGEVSGTQSINITNEGGQELVGLGAGITYGTPGVANWLTASLSPTTAPSQLHLAADATALIPGDYGAQVWISAPSALNSPASVTVTLSVAEPRPRIRLNPESASFTAVRGEPIPDPQAVTVENGGGGSLVGLAVSVDYGSATTGWVEASLDRTAAPAQLTLRVDHTELTPGSYVADVIVTSPVADNDPVVLELDLLVVDAGPRVMLTPDQVQWSAQEGQQSPAPVEIQVTNGGGDTLDGLASTVLYGDGEPTGWLEASLEATTAPTVLQLVPTTSSLAAGAYSATVGVVSSQEGSVSGAVAVSLVVGSPPAAPSGLTAVAASPTSVDLIWTDNSADETSFVVERASEGGDWSDLVILGANVVVHTDASAEPETSYDYRVRACRSSICSDPSDVASVTTPPAQTPPAAPTALNAIAVSQSTIDLSWVDQSNNETSFELERSADGGVTWGALTQVATNVTTHQDAGLPPSTSYSYRVRACNVQGCSGWSSPAAATTFAPPQPPAAPTDLVATAVSFSQIDLTWTDASADETSFAVERSTNGGASWSALAVTGANVNSLTDSGLPSSTTFWYRVQACNADGCSDWSATASATTQAPPPPPAAPTGLGAVASSHAQIDLAWTDASDTEDSFELERSTDAGASWSQIVVTAPNATSFSDTGVAPETQYWYRVRSCVVGQCSGYSNVATATTPAAPTPPSVPTGFTATPISTTRIDLAWTDTSDDEDRFEVHWRRGTSGTWQFQTVVGANQTSFSATGLRKNSPYQFRLRACNEVGCSSWIIVEARTPK